MAANWLKHYRGAAGLAQSEVAKAVGVTQPTYQRWEASKSEIPEEKLPALAQVLGTSKEQLLGRHEPVRAAFCDNSAPRELQYYGEVAIHFQGGGEALLLSISEDVRGRLWDQLQEINIKYIGVRDLGNRTVAVRKDAISDLYFSSEAYDDYGPENHDPGGYTDGTSLHNPDLRDWAIIYRLALDSGDLEDFAEEDVKRLEEALFISNEEWQKRVGDGEIRPEDLESRKKRHDEEVERIFEQAKDITYQLSNSGKKRSMFVLDANGSFYLNFDHLVDEGETFINNDILIMGDGYHRDAFINLNAVDYISVPTHILEEHVKEEWADDCDAMASWKNEEDEKLVKKPRKKK